jgi:hypothetical protein
MAIIRYRDPVDGTIKEMACLKGDKGDPGSGSGATNAKDVAYDGSEQYISETNVADALDHLFAEVGGFSEMLDELHAYAQGLVNGGAAE